MSVLFRNSQKAVGVLRSSVIALAESVLADEGASGKEVSVLFVDDAAISELNAKHLARTGPTDVLAFPMGESQDMTGHPALLGDVVVSAERALAYTEAHGADLCHELSLYLIHGLLHLLGYDDTNPTEEGTMRAKETELLRKASRQGLLIKRE